MPETRKSAEAYRTISEVAHELELGTHVLRFWETKFTQIKPLKRAGGRRYYRPEDVAFLRGIQRLLHDEGYTIKGVQKFIREHGMQAVLGVPHSARTAGGTPPRIHIAESRGAVTAEALAGAYGNQMSVSEKDRESLTRVLEKLQALRARLVALD